MAFVAVLTSDLSKACVSVPEFCSQWSAVASYCWHSNVLFPLSLCGAIRTQVRTHTHLCGLVLLSALFQKHHPQHAEEATQVQPLHYPPEVCKPVSDSGCDADECAGVSVHTGHRQCSNYSSSLPEITTTSTFFSIDMFLSPKDEVFF